MASLDMLFRQRGIGDLDVEVFLVDDGCTDRTGDAIRSRFPAVHILRGNGELYWSGGMQLAFAVAMNIGFDAYIFLNDDTMLYRDALARLVSLARERLEAGSAAIVVGSTRSPSTGLLNYGGLMRKISGLSVDLEIVQMHASVPIPCDTMHGNFVLIPAEVAAVVGNLEERFQHQFADIDYGLRAKCAGFDVVVMPGYAGDCSDNSYTGTWRDSDLAFGDRWHHLMSPKGVPVGEWALFTRRHFGWRWLPYAISPYVKTIASSAFSCDLWRREKPPLAYERRSL